MITQEQRSTRVPQPGADPGRFDLDQFAVDEQECLSAGDCYSCHMVPAAIIDGTVADCAQA